MCILESLEFKIINSSEVSYLNIIALACGSELIIVRENVFIIELFRVYVI